MSEPPATSTGTPTGAFLFGVRIGMTSVFTFVIAFTYIGFGALAHDYGFSVGWAMLSTALQWAGPAQVILVTGLGAGTSLIEIAVAVALSSVRLLPIVVALLPMVRTEGARAWRLIVPAHFMAVSVWVEVMRHGPGMPREHRLPFCNGMGVDAGARRHGGDRGRLLHAVAAAGRVRRRGHVHHADLVPGLDRAQRARCCWRSPRWRLASSSGRCWRSARCEFDLLWTGVIGGTLAYGLHRLQRRRSAAP